MHRKAKVDTVKYPIDYYFRSLQATVGMNFSHPMEKTPVWAHYIDGRTKSFMKLNKAIKQDTSQSVSQYEDSEIEQ